MKTTPVVYRWEFCPYCREKTEQRITELLDYPDDKATGYEARECSDCDNSSVWFKGQMKYPTDKLLEGRSRRPYPPPAV